MWAASRWLRSASITRWQPPIGKCRLAFFDARVGVGHAPRFQRGQRRRPARSRARGRGDGNRCGHGTRYCPAGVQRYGAARLTGRPRRADNTDFGRHGLSCAEILASTRSVGPQLLLLPRPISDGSMRVCLDSLVLIRRPQSGSAPKYLQVACLESSFISKVLSVGF
jgi:hypothetical protein